MVRAKNMFLAGRVALGVLLAGLLLGAYLFMPAKAHAATSIDVDTVSSLELSIAPSGQPAKDIEFDLYRVADISFNSEFTPVGAFGDYVFSFEDITTEKWRELAFALSTAVREDGVPAAGVAVTDLEGKALFPELPVGLYLVVADSFYMGDIIVVPTPFMVCLPSLSPEDEWVYDVQADVKYVLEREPEPPSETLPKTGTLWWPVPLLLVSGLLLVVIGLVRHRGARRDA